MEKLIPLVFLATAFLATMGSSLRRARREEVAAQLLDLRGSFFAGEGDELVPAERRDRRARSTSRLRKVLRVLAPFSSRLPSRIEDEQLEKAGVSLSSDEFQALRLLLLVSLLALIFLVGGPVLAGLSAPPVAMLSWHLPRLVVKRKQTRRQDQISDSLPEVLELLTLLLLAGQGLKTALPRAVACSHGPLRDELLRTFRSMELGMPRQQAFLLLEERNDSEDLRRFVRVVQRAERFGAPLASSMEHLAAEMRHRQKSRLQERAHKAPVKILFPLVFLILPSFLLLTVGGMLLGGRFR
jgi:tight adherence protein C